MSGDEGRRRKATNTAALAQTLEPQEPPALADTLLPVGGGVTLDDTADLPRNYQAPTFEGYVVLDRLGEGGMGVVYAAYDPKLDRKVALKVLRPRRWSDEDAASATARLQREAQAMAKLSHPNVVTVYQVGAHGETIFIAMELIVGATLSGWLKAKTRSHQDVVAVLVKAGRGLEAAHKAGLVHRDFKPDNILIGDEGRVRVTDFGLAREDVRGLPGGEDSEPEVRPSRELVKTSESSAGNLAGTPRYMAPEQHVTAKVDARADQFSFCVTLYEALYGVRPFDGATYAEIVFNVTNGPLRPIPATPKVPRNVRTALTRGLSIDPAQRYASMSELLAELDRGPASVRNLAIAFIGVAGIAVGTASFVTRHDAAPAVKPCSDSADKIAQDWNPARRDAIGQAFKATGLPYAELARASVVDILDKRANAWITMHRDACEATRVRGDQSEALLDRRMLCLEHRRAELAELVGVLTTGGADIVQNAPTAAEHLPPLDICSDAEALMSDVALPTTPAARAELDSLHHELARGQVLLTAARFDASLEIARAAVERATKLAYLPVEAEALLLDGLVESQRGDNASGVDLLTRAAEVADAGRADRVKATALIELVLVLGYNAAKPSEADRVSRMASAALARAGNQPDLEAKLLRNIGANRFGEGKYQDAADVLEKALAIQRKVYGEDHSEVATTLDHLGTTELRLNKVDEARTYQERAVAILERVLGPDHPSTAEAINNLGNVYASMGDTDAAEQRYRKALEISQRSFGEKHVMVAVSHANLGALALGKNDYDGALAEFQHALEIERVVLGPSHPSTAETLTDIGQVEIARGKPDRAVTPLTDALKIWESSTHVPVEGQLAKFALAQAVWAGGDHARALTLAKDARTALIAEGPFTKDSVDEITAWLAKR